MRWLLLLTALLLASASPAKQPEPLSKKTQKLFAWFDQLGLEDTSKAKFIHIRTGDYGELDRVHLVEECLGWLLDDQGETFRALLPDLTVAEFAKHGSTERDPDYCGYREASLEQEAKSLVQALKKANYFKVWDDATPWRDDDRIPRRAQIFAIARACAQRHLEPLAQDLLRALASHPMTDGLNRRKEKIEDWVERDLDRVMIWRFHCEYRSPTSLWADMLAAQKKYFRLSLSEPQDVSDRDTEDKLAGLARNAKEEAEDARRGPIALEKLSDAERAVELVRRLRDEVDENLDGESMPRGWPWKPRGTNGAMEALRKLGLPAVPALLAELRSGGRPSRGTHYMSRWGGGIWTSGTRDLAVSVLNDIAGVNFLYVTDFARLKAEEQWPVVVKAVDEWRTALQTKGEKQWLIEKLNEGGENAEWFLPRLQEKFPDSAAEIMIPSATANKDPRARAAIVQKLWKVRGPKADEFLRQEFKEGPSLANRVVAAYALRQRGEPGVEETILAEWLKMAADPKADHRAMTNPGEPNGVVLPSDKGAPPAASGRHALLFLMGTGSGKIMHALLDAWPGIPTSIRGDLVDQLSERNFGDQSETVQLASPEVRTWMKEILLTAMEDTSADFPPRLCDLAGAALHEKWPDKFPFNIHASASARERQRLALVNPHRREAGLAELPAPPPRPKVAPGKENHVTSIDWLLDSAKPSAALAARLQSWKGQPLTPAAFTDLLVAFAKKPEPRSAELLVQLLRDGDDTGLAVQLKLVAGAVPKPSVYDSSASVFQNGESTHLSGGSGPLSTITDPKHWAGLRKSIAAALAAPPHELFSVTVQLTVH